MRAKKQFQNREALARHFAELGFKKGAEVGVCYGLYSKVLLDNIPDLHLLAVDRWETYEGYNRRRRQDTLEDAFVAATELLSPYKGCEILRGDSLEVAKTIPDGSLDFVFIDADHAYHAVVKDVAAWAPKVRKGGIVSGHDYYESKSGGLGVIPAVNEYVIANDKVLYRTAWDRTNPSRDDRQPSWYFTN